MNDLTLLAVQDLGDVRDGAAKGSSDALVTETDAEDGDVDGRGRGDDGLDKGRGEAEVGRAVRSTRTGGEDEAGNVREDIGLERLPKVPWKEG
jgi:hypothetical protein